MAKGRQVEFLMAGLRDSSGNPLASGKVYSYVVGTTTDSLLYADRNLTTPLSNPITLDARGAKLAFGSGIKRIKVFNSADVEQYDWDGISLSYQTEWINFTPTITLSGAMTLASSTIHRAQYKNDGSYININCFFTLNFGGVASNTINMSLPENAEDWGTLNVQVHNTTDGIIVDTQSYHSDSTLVIVQEYSGGHPNFTLAKNYNIYIEGCYPGE